MLSVQNGVYFKRNSRPGKSFSIVFLKIGKKIESKEIAEDISNLWKNLMSLEKGIVTGLPVSEKHRYAGNLSTLIGFSDRIFSISGIQRSKPKDFSSDFFNYPGEDPNRKIADGVSLKYEENVTHNAGLDADIIIQFIGDDEAITNRAVMETWRHLNDETRGNSSSIGIIRNYSGYNSSDGRNLLNFHDGISNIKTEERPSFILMNESSLNEKDKWFTNGTFMSFLRMSIDLEIWEKLDRKYQERIIGRDKLTGCPIIGINGNDENIPLRDCPVKGTTEITEKGNEIYREFDPAIYGRLFGQYDSNKGLSGSHIEKMILSKGNAHKRNKIYRQGYNFMERSDDYPYLKIGLNFVSFQNDLNTFFDLMKYGFGQKSTNPTIYNLTQFLSTTTSGLFLIPPLQTGERFPGEGIFVKNKLIDYEVNYLGN